MEHFYETLFEVSNDYRYNMLLLLQEKPMRITEISKKLELTTQEISRHASRLGESGLIYKDVEGFYQLTNYGDLIHILLEEFLFVSKHRDYFIDHSVIDLSPEFIKRMGELSESKCINNTLEFLHFMDNIIRESKEMVWLQVDQYPLTFLGSIIEGYKKGVKFRIIEQSEIVAGPRMSLESIEETNAILSMRNTSLSEQKIHDKVGVFMFLSEDKCAVAFPTKGSVFDYKGFISSDIRSVMWCKELFQYYWDRSNPIYQSSSKLTELAPIPVVAKPKHGAVLVEGHDSLADAKMVQDAVDQYDDVLLRGTFNFGTSTVKISKSVRIRGEVNNGQLMTKIYKKGWSFPFFDFESIFEVNGANAEVVIESIHFTDFNCSCINGRRAKSLKILDNKMTLETGYGRGWKYSQYGDIVTGIWLESPPTQQSSGVNFSGGVVIEGNYLDFAQAQSEKMDYNLAPAFSNYVSSQPKLDSHEYYISIGINIFNLSEKIEIKHNTIKNMNARGISISENFSKADVIIDENIIESSIPGSYPFKGSEAGVGIFAQNSSLKVITHSSLRINDNTVQIDNPDYCGIMVLGFELDDDKTNTIIKGNITNNKIYLQNGQASIKIDSDNFEVVNNTLSGKVFFGVMRTVKGITGSLSSNENNELMKNNDVNNLRLMDPRWWVSRHGPI